MFTNKNTYTYSSYPFVKKLLYLHHLQQNKLYLYIQKKKM